jgi:hypothetical protein
MPFFLEICCKRETHQGLTGFEEESPIQQKMDDQIVLYQTLRTLKPLLHNTAKAVVLLSPLRPLLHLEYHHGILESSC